MRSQQRRGDVMNFKNWALAAIVGGAMLAGCSKKPPPPPPPEPAPPVVEAEPAPAPMPEPAVDTVAERRARIEARVAEVFKPVYFSFDQSSLDAAGKA